MKTLLFSPVSNYNLTIGRPAPAVKVGESVRR